MITFPNAKINIGLHITEKRSDGFHNLETVMYPIPLTDALEFVESDSLHFESSGFNIDGDPEQNLVLKAYYLLKEKFDLPLFTSICTKISRWGLVWVVDLPMPLSC